LRRLALALIFAAAPAWANDSTAELDNNGLRLLHEPDIAMASEDLSISDKAVHIVYEFVNHGASDKVVTLAFPMPDITGGVDANVGLPSTDSSDPFHFRVSADGVPAGVHLEAAAFVGATDVTARLKAMHVPLMPFAKGAGEALDHQPTLKKPKLVKEGLAAEEQYASKPDGPMEKHLTPLWTWRAAYVWRQNFPAGRPVRLLQDYAPSVGGTAGTQVGHAGWRASEDGRTYLARYCIDGDFEASVKRAAAAAHAEYSPFTEERINYVLRTGANWAGPIGRFHLTVDKGAPNTLISFCGEGVRKLDATRFEMSASDFTPKDDLHILILTPLAR